MTAGPGKRVEYEAAKKDERRAKTKEKSAKLRLKIKTDEQKIKDYMGKIKYIEETHLGRVRGKIDHFNAKIKELNYVDIEIRSGRSDDAEIAAAKRDERKAKREKHIARYKLRIAHLDDRMKYYLTKMEYIEDKHIARLKGRIEKHKSQIKDLEHIAKW